jgi:hypothetical protein
MLTQGAAACGKIDHASRDTTDGVPPDVTLYLRHTATGVSLRALAREQGCHASTILRQVRRLENRRDDPLVDKALARMDAALRHLPAQPAKGEPAMNHNVSQTRPTHTPIVADVAHGTEASQALGYLHYLAGSGAVLVVAHDMPKAVIMREDATGQTHRLAILDRALAEEMALRDWISCQKPGRVACYVLTPAGQLAMRAHQAQTGDAEGDARGRARYGQAESAVAILARRRDKDGAPFLSPALVTAAERLREDFVTAQLSALPLEPVDSFLTKVEGRKKTGPNIAPPGTRAAARRFVAVLRDLGPGLGDVALRCCCYGEGVEAAETALGWSARSGKIVLRIALHRLRLQYDRMGDEGMLMG